MTTDVTTGQDRWYRTFVRGRLVQQSALTVGGSDSQTCPADITCARDGAGRLVIPGTGLAGALIETAGRICPDLLKTELGNRDHALKRITSKTSEPGGGDESPLWQSVVRVYPSHPVTDADCLDTELRQGVGIRQATGATATKKKALFDMETVPAGTAWELLIEIDTLRGGPAAERLVLLALDEWAHQRCWLGAAAARGTGWMCLEDIELVRLPLTEQAIDAWPSNTFEQQTGRWQYLTQIDGACHGKGSDDLRRWAEEFDRPALSDDRFWYMTLDAEIVAGPAANGYGLDAVSVGGHAAALVAPLSENLLGPNGLGVGVFRKQYNPDAPVVVTRRTGAQCDEAEPLLPGSGIRGPLRHATSRWFRGSHGEDLDPSAIPDPNDPGWPIDGESDDAVSKLFGLATRSARLLVRDGLLVHCANPASDADRTYCLALFQHHAEDEFAGGVYGSGKFDRTAVIEGTFQVRLVIEASDCDQLKQHMATIAPALRLAELGHLPLGGGKWRGFGWLPWRFRQVELRQAGDRQAKTMLKNPQKNGDWILPVVERLDDVECET